MPDEHAHLEPLPASLEPLPVDPASPRTPPTAVVALGGSAGALDAYERFFLGLPPLTGLAFVVVTHLDPRHRGLMPDILRRCTTLPVAQITDGTVLQADQVYVIPPGHSLSVQDGVLHLGDLADAGGMVIDTFFEALAADQGERAVGIVLSGMGSDGTRGIQAIKQRGGRVLVQEPDTAEYASMPSSAAATDLADDVLPVDALAARLLSLTHPARTLDSVALITDGDPDGAPLHRILRLVQSRTGHDFSRYKRTTLIRRIERRMLGWRVQDVSQYLRLLEEVPSETEALFQDFTINVTSFFRDVEAYEALKEHLRDYLQASAQQQGTLRVWVAACSTGEEAYSVAIVLHELLGEISADHAVKVQIFATDIDQTAIDRARQGLYSRDIAYLISPERLSRYFFVKGDRYQVRADIRESVVFAAHSTFGDPPFTRLDLLCCRNMLIYVNSALQGQILALFRYALRPRGLLFLGASETVGTQRGQFQTLDQRWKIYQRLEGLAELPPMRHAGVSAGPGQEAGGRAGRLPSSDGYRPDGYRSDGSRSAELAQQTQKALLADYAPPTVVVGGQGEVRFVHGRTARYLELSPGQGLNNVFEMARGELRYQLPTAVRQALNEGRRVVRSGLQVDVEGASQTLDLIVTPLPGPESGLVMIAFQERPDSPGTAGLASPEKTDQVVALELELQHSRETLQATGEEMAITLEEVRSTNEELQSINEELQSSNEELMTSKEELQSLNEELSTINAEHQVVIHDLAQANDDTNNLLEGAGTATVFLDNDLKIRRFTPFINAIIPLTQADLGRPINDFHVGLRYGHLLQDITRVLKTLESFEVQVQTTGTPSREGADQTGGDQWYLLRVSPYRTADNYIRGVVVAFTNIDLIKAQEPPGGQGG